MWAILYLVRISRRPLSSFPWFLLPSGTWSGSFLRLRWFAHLVGEEWCFVSWWLSRLAFGFSCPSEMGWLSSRWAITTWQSLIQSRRSAELLLLGCLIGHQHGHIFDVAALRSVNIQPLLRKWRRSSCCCQRRPPGWSWVSNEDIAQLVDGHCA